MNDHMSGILNCAAKAFLAATALASMLGCSAAYSPVRMDSKSMLPLVGPGDKFILNKGEAARSKLHDGDVIAFQHGDYTIVKRILAMPGETISGLDRKVIRNGQAVPEPYLQPVSPNDAPLTTSFDSRTVPQGELFVLGDNRDNSFDSRAPEFGAVHISDVVGTYSWTYWRAPHDRK